MEPYTCGRLGDLQRMWGHCYLSSCFAAGSSLLTCCGVCLLVGGATRIVTQVAWVNFYNGGMLCMRGAGCTNCYSPSAWMQDHLWQGVPPSQCMAGISNAGTRQGLLFGIFVARGPRHVSLRVGGIDLSILRGFAAPLNPKPEKLTKKGLF